MRIVTLIMILPAVLWPQDLREIVRRSIELDRRNTELTKNYGFLQRLEEQQLDHEGKMKHRDIRTWDVTVIEGSAYRRLVARNGQPLSPKDQQLEAEKLRKTTELRRKETPEQRARRISEWEKSLLKRREPLQELPEAFNFKLVGEEGGAYVIEATPKPGYKPRISGASLLSSVKGRFWIDKRDSQWAKVDLETLDTVAFGGVVVRISKGSHLVMEQTRVDNEVWLPKMLDLQVAARVLIFKGFRRRYIYNFSEFKKLQPAPRAGA